MLGSRVNSAQKLCFAVKAQHRNAAVAGSLDIDMIQSRGCADDHPQIGRGFDYRTINRVVEPDDQHIDVAERAQ